MVMNRPTVGKLGQHPSGEVRAPTSFVRPRATLQCVVVSKIAASEQLICFVSFFVLLYLLYIHVLCFLWFLRFSNLILLLLFFLLFFYFFFFTFYFFFLFISILFCYLSSDCFFFQRVSSLPRLVCCQRATRVARDSPGGAGRLSHGMRQYMSDGLRRQALVRLLVAHANTLTGCVKAEPFRCGFRVGGTIVLDRSPPPQRLGGGTRRGSTRGLTSSPTSTR
jgi:hypothetical protein